MKSRISLAIALAFALAMPAFAQTGIAIDASHVGVYQNGIRSRKIYRKLEGAAPNFYYEWGLVPRRNETASGEFAWVSQPSGDSRLSLTLRFDLFNAGFKTDALTALKEIQPDAAQIYVEPVPVASCQFLLGPSARLPRGVTLVSDVISAPGDFVFLEFDVDTAVWTPEKLPELKSLLNRVPLQAYFSVEGYRPNSNEVTVRLSTEAATELFRDLEGDSLPGSSGARYVTRDGLRKFRTKVQSRLQVIGNVRVQDKFDAHLGLMIADMLKAEEVVKQWDEVLAQCTAQDYHPDDLRPDVVQREFESAMDRLAESTGRRNEMSVSGGASFAGFGGTAGFSKARELVNELAREKGLVVEWEGDKFTAKALRLHQVNETALQSVSIFQMKTNYATETTFDVLESLRISDALEQPGPMVKVHAAVAERDRAREELRQLKATSDAEIATLKTRITALETQIVAVTPKARKSWKETVANTEPVEAVGCWPLASKGDAEMATHKGGASVECTTHLVFDERTISVEIEFYCKENKGDQTAFGGESRKRVIWTAPRGKRIVGISVPADQRKATFSRKVTKGAHNDFEEFDKAGYWDYLQYRIDGPGTDSNYVGARGRVKPLEVQLEE